MSSPEANLDYDVDFYIPEFLWNLWLESCPVDMYKRASDAFSGFLSTGLHVFDVNKNELSTGSNKHPYSFEPFDPIRRAVPRIVDKPEWVAANNAFSALEREAETAIRSLMQQVDTKLQPSKLYGINTSRKDLRKLGKSQLSLGIHALQSLQKYLIFLRFRNRREFWTLLKLSTKSQHDGSLSTLKEKNREHLDTRKLLESFTCFLTQDYIAHQNISFVADCIHKNYKNLGEAELCLGVSPEPDEYILSPACFGDVGGDEGERQTEDVYNYFFPVSPHFTIYILIDYQLPSLSDERTNHFLHPTAYIKPAIEHDTEYSDDVYQRNTLILQTAPPYVIFVSSRSMIRTLTYYNERRWLPHPENLDFSKLLRGCREESVTHMLLVKASIEVIDLTDDVTLSGEYAVCHGTFADVWKGVWSDRLENTDKFVALKALRANLVGYAQEKLLQRLKAEIKAWYRLDHPNIAKFYGIMQLPNTLAMVSPWCKNGTVVKYLEEVNPGANRLQLCYEVASGVEYLHKCSPLVVHGDLKSFNILIDDEGHAVITDFGLAKVKEEVSDVLPSSFFGGSTRWMAPELLVSQIEDEKRSSFTTYTDVYAFASVCLEILTGELPYANRRNDHGVTFDIMSGLKPTSGLKFVNDNPKTVALWSLLNKCWDRIALIRPDMTQMRKFLNLIRH